jgi:uroporphyrinogen-III synthase
MRVIVTRPLAQAETLVDDLRRGGIDAVALPLIDIVPAQDLAPLRQAWRELGRYALVMFVSANAVQQFMQQRPPGFDWPAGVLAGSTGPGTSAALHAAGVPRDSWIEPAGQVYDSEALWEQLRTRAWAGRQVLVVRGENGRDWLSEQLVAAGAQVEFVAAYGRQAPRWDASARRLLGQALAQPQQHLWAFSSSEAVGHLRRLAPGADWSRACALASHPRIVASARRLGFGQVSLAAISASAVTQELLVRERASIQSRTP